MSWENVKEAYRTRLGNPAAKELLALVIDEANADGLAFVGLDRLVFLTELKKRTVFRVLQVFELIGLVSRTEALLKGHLLPAFQVDLEKLGGDLRQPYAVAYSSVQKKPFGQRRSDTRRTVAATRKSVAATSGSVAATLPPHPLIGGPSVVPFLSHTPQPPQAGASVLFLDPLDAATDQVCSALGIANRRKRRPVKLAIALAAEKGDLPATIALEMIAAVRDQDKLHLDGALKFKYGLTKFLGEGIWRDRDRWAWDTAELKQQAAARIGSR
jgi:hypothetical protein